MLRGVDTHVNSTNTKPAALAAHGIEKTFGPTTALAGATIELLAGEVHALLGENGSGKSTLAKILTGLIPADKGHISRLGAPVMIRDPAAARAIGIGIVFQDLSLAPDLSVVENLFLGREKTKNFLKRTWLDKATELDLCRSILRKVGSDVEPLQSVGSLGIAQKQMVEIAKALLQDPAIVIFDEPTASLTEREVTRLFSVIDELRHRDTAILYVTHHLREVLRIADRVSFMKAGRIVDVIPVTPATTEGALLFSLTGKVPETTDAREASPRGTPLLKAVGLETSHCSDVSFQVRQGEIIGLYGTLGSGREEISRVLVGMQSLASGSIDFDGAAYRVSSPAMALERGIGYLASDRVKEGILPNRSVRENLTLASLPHIARAGFIRTKAEKQATTPRLAALKVKYASAEDLITSLSGGNQQKVLLGRILSANPKLLVLEDPTAGIDVGAKHEIYEHLRRCAADGMSIVWLSSDLVETLTLCDRVYAFYAGRIVDEIVAPSLDHEDRLLTAVLGGGMAEQNE